MKNIKLLFLSFVSASIILTGCSDNDDDDDIKTYQLRITHASPDAPKVNIYLDGEAALENIDYKQSSGIMMMTESTVEVEVRGILSDGSELSVIGPVDIDMENETLTDIVAYDNVLDGADINIKPKVIVSDISEDSVDVLVSVFHAAPAVGDVDIYVTEAGDSLNNYTPIDAQFSDFAGPVTLMADTDYQVLITPDGSNQVVYDSGVVSFTAGSELILAAVENTTGIGDNPVNLLAIAADGANEVFASGTGAEVRFVHNSADTPAVDILVNGGEVIDGLLFPEASAYDQVAAPEGTYNVVVAADADNTIAPIDIDVELQQGQSYTAIAVGGLNGVTDSTIEPILTVDDRRTVATEAKLRVVHGSYAVAENIPVDVYLTPTAEIIDASAAIESLAYTSATDQLSVAPGDYFITVTAAGDKSVVAFATDAAITLNGDQNYTVIARDPSDMEMGAPLILATVLAE